MTGRPAAVVAPSARTRLVTTAAALAEEIIARDLPSLGAIQRAAAVGLVAKAMAALPDSVRPGVSLAGLAVGVRRRWAGAGWSDTDLPVLREYVRLVRGLALAAAGEVSELSEEQQVGRP